MQNYKIVRRKANKIVLLENKLKILKKWINSYQIKRIILQSVKAKVS